jgi:hypothetical protein
MFHNTVVFYERLFYELFRIKCTIRFVVPKLNFRLYKTLTKKEAAFKKEGRQLPLRRIDDLLYKSATQGCSVDLLLPGPQENNRS